MMALTWLPVALVAVKAAMLPEPVAAKPIDGALLVQL